MQHTKPIDRSYEISENLVLQMQVLLSTPSIQEKEFVKIKGEELLEELRKFHSMVKNY